MARKKKKVRIYEVRTNGRLTKTFRVRKRAKEFAIKHKSKNPKKEVLLIYLEKER